jgi:hypothetical protein
MGVTLLVKTNMGVLDELETDLVECERITGGREERLLRLAVCQPG